MPDDVLTNVVARDGLCFWAFERAELPELTGDDPPDRELAARLCAGCPVIDECLELDLRSAGPDTLGVWGALPDTDRRALHPVWLRRRGGEASMTLTLSPTQVLAGVAVLFALFTIWRFGARRARRAAETARAGARVVSLAGRVLFTGSAFVGVQWLVITHPGNPTLLLVVLGAPDLVAAYVLTRALTVTSLDTTRRGGGRR